MRGVSSLGGAVILAACIGATGPEPAPSVEDAAVSVEPVMIDALLPDVRARSCPDGVTYTRAQPISVDAEPLAFGGEEAAVLFGARFVGVWHLTSDEPNFGGLSGLSVLPSGSLMAVSDGGAFVWIGMEAGRPDGLGAISYMMDEAGKLLSGKQNSDSEGLDFIDGVALVGFERNHRLLAYDLEGCGANARGALVTTVSNRPAGLSAGFTTNKGLEAVMVDLHGAIIGGLETDRAGQDQAAIATLTREGLAFDERLARPDGPLLVGLDTDGDTSYAVFRSYTPVVGNVIEVRAYSSLDDDGRIIARLARPYTVDNFEGIAAWRLEDGTVRLFLISDDNFSERQRTLLLVLDVEVPTP